MAQGAPFVYNFVEGDWDVPYVNGDPSAPGQTCYSSAWVGLDGNTTNDLVQAGTEQDATVVTGWGTVTNYYTWTEVFPNQPMQEIFNVLPGDPIGVQVWVGDSKGNVDLTGAYAWFYIEDLRSGEVWKASTPLGKSFGFTGNSAEWIVEWPCLGKCGTSYPTYPELAQYSSFEMTGAYVQILTKITPYSKAENEQFAMRENYDPKSDNNVLSTVSSATGYADSMQFFWKNCY